MTLYRLYLRTRVRRELLAPGQAAIEPQCFLPSPSGREERPTMICDDQRYSYVISGREEFEAENDAAALAVARVIGNAAGDLCDAFELWDGTRHVDPSRIVPLDPSIVSASHQDDILRTEEALLSSRWAIAHSRRLLARVKELRGETASAPSAPPAARQR